MPSRKILKQNVVKILVVLHIIYKYILLFSMHISFRTYNELLLPDNWKIQFVFAVSVISFVVMSNSGVYLFYRRETIRKSNDLFKLHWSALETCLLVSDFTLNLTLN